MKIAHIADIHWGLGYPGPTPTARFDDVCRVMDWVADRIIVEQCDMVLVAGDMFRKADIVLEKASKEIRACTAWLRKITGAGVEVVIISGTPSHDPISAYELLKDYRLPLVHIDTERTTTELAANIGLVLLPGMDRSNFAAKEEYRGLPAHVMHQMMTNDITEYCQREGERFGDWPKILVSHLTYDLADTGFEDVLMQQEAILTTEAVQGYDLVCLGHIHRPQQNGSVFYSGSPERLSFNDEKVDAGFWIHEWDGNRFNSQYIKTPARCYMTLKFNEDQIRECIGAGGIRYILPPLKDAIVRVNYSCSDELNKQLNRRDMEKALYDCGAFFVAEIKGDIARSDRARDEAVTEALGPIEAVRKWSTNQGHDAAEIDELAAMTALLMEVA
ncbi:MAG: metallophosphoesterase family protein [Sporomusa sp.]